MSGAARGEIHHPDRYKQLHDFSGFELGRITPTDIDGLIEYAGKCFVFMEFKHYRKPIIDDGQRWALERLCRFSSKPAICFLCLHHQQPHEEIDCAGADVSRFYWREEWRFPPEPVTAGEAVRRFLIRFAS